MAHEPWCKEQNYIARPVARLGCWAPTYCPKCLRWWSDSILKQTWFKECGYPPAPDDDGLWNYFLQLDNQK